MKKYFVTGLVIMLPVALTILIVFFVVNFLTKPFMGFFLNLFTHWEIFKSHPQFIKYISQFIILIGIFLFTLVLGVFARWFLFNSLLKISDKILHKIPLVNKVYKTTQDIIKTLLITDKNSFKQVVMAPFPRQGLYSLGFISRNGPETCRKAANQELISVFVPTTPNPTTGFLLLFKKEDLIYLDMKTEDAVKYIVSCGVIMPDQKTEIKK